MERHIPDFMKLVIPFINGFTLSDISKESGFVAAFDQDDNKPVDGSFIYLVFDPTIYTEQTIKTLKKINNLKSVYSIYDYRIDNKVYTIYKIRANSRRLENLISGHVNLDIDMVIRILQFWGFTDEYVNSVCLNIGNKIFSNNMVSVPIKDFQRPAFANVDRMMEVPTNYRQL